MQHRRYKGQQEASERKPLTAEQKATQKEKASCYLVIQFKDGNRWAKWSNEWAQPNKIRNLSEAVTEMLRICDKHFAGRIHSAAIFDVRRDKSPSAETKIYQFEHGAWLYLKETALSTL